MTIGQRRHRVTIKTPIRTVDSLGGYTEVWKTLRKTWASIESTGSNERVMATQQAGTATHRLRLPYLDGVTLSAQVITLGRTFNVRGIENPEERNIDLVLMCEERLTG